MNKYFVSYAFTYKKGFRKIKGYCSEILVTTEEVKLEDGFHWLARQMSIKLVVDRKWKLKGIDVCVLNFKELG